MNTIDVLNYIPLICPQRQFRDKAGQPSAYVDTNPSLFVDASGNVTILVRQVNYRKFKDRSFVVGEQVSRSEYTTMYGTYDNNQIRITSTMSLEFNTPLQRYSTYWYGLEDIRFITPTTVLATCPELGPGGNPRVVYGELTRPNQIQITHLLDGETVEKNWMPYLFHDSPFVVYSVSPLVIRPLRVNQPITLHAIPELAGYHGSTNGIPFRGGYLFLIHKYDRKTENRWLYIHMNSRQFAYSEPFAFFQHSYIEFPCSLVQLPDEKIAVSLGVNDCMAYIAILNQSVIELCETVRFTN
jgi:hypothetical protein